MRSSKVPPGVPRFPRVWRYLLAGLDGEELVLSFGTAHVSKRPVVGDVSGDEGDLIHHVLVFDHLVEERTHVRFDGKKKKDS